MREYDDDSNIQHYAPVLRRIIILVAVITAVPVMLWTITAFMHTYIAQPTIPAPRPLATATAAPASPAADTANPAAPSQPAPAVTDAKATDRLQGRSDARQRRQYWRTECPSRLYRHCFAGSVRRARGSTGSSRSYGAGSASTRAQRFPGPAIIRAAAADAGTDSKCRGRYLAAAGPDHRPGSLAAASSQRAGACGHRHTAATGPSGDAPEPPSVTPDAPPSGYDPGIGH